MRIKLALSAIGTAILILGATLYLLPKRASAPTPPATQLVASVPAREVIGASVEGRSIEAYTYGEGATHLVFVGGIHGGYEWNSVLLAYTLMDYLDAHPEIIPAGESITVVPDANPDGVYKIVGKEGRFALSDVPPAGTDESPGRFNANNVDINRNFDCKWQAKGTWKNKTVSAGTAPFSEPEVRALRDYFESARPAVVVFWHSKSNAVYASQCEDGILPKTLDAMSAYANATGYAAVKEFTAYPTTGAADDWLASIGIPAITVELQTHETVEWERNWKGIRALFSLFSTTR